MNGKNFMVKMFRNADGVEKKLLINKRPVKGLKNTSVWGSRGVSGTNRSAAQYEWKNSRALGDKTLDETTRKAMQETQSEAQKLLAKQGIASPSQVQDPITRGAILRGEQDPSMAAAHSRWSKASAQWSQGNYLGATGSAGGAAMSWLSGSGLAGSRRASTVAARVGATAFALDSVGRLKNGTGDPLTKDGRFDVAGLPFI